MCDRGVCRDPDSDYYSGPCPEAACGLWEDAEQVDMDFLWV